MSMSKLQDQRNHTELSVSATEQDARYHFQKYSILTAIQHHSQMETDDLSDKKVVTLR